MTKQLLVLAIAAMALCAAAHAASDCKLLRIADWEVKPQTGRLYVEGAINGQKVDILLDTGAGASFVVRAAADRLGVGVDALETDGHVTRDGQLVLAHDPSAARMTGAQIAWVDLELADGDGTDLADALLARRTTLPLAFFTTGASPALVQSARACGPVFVKPDVEPLLAWVKRTLRPSQPPPTQ